LDSLLQQTYENLEVIVVDDGSTDRTAEIVRQYGDAHPDFRLALVVKENGGSHSAIEVGVAQARGDFIAILNSDDRFTSNRLEVLLSAMKAEGADLAFSDVDFIAADSSFVDESSIDYISAIREKIDGASDFPSMVYACLDSNIAVSTGNFVFRRDLYRRLGGFKALKLCHDWDFLLRAQLSSRVCFVKQRLYQYRVHGNNTFADVQDLAIAETGNVMQGFFSLLNIDSARNLFPDLRYFADFMIAHGFERHVPSLGRVVGRGPERRKTAVNG
jgi:glycosyltransferase involved in cell wall biosynthesis